MNLPLAGYLHTISNTTKNLVGGSNAYSGEVPHV